MSYSIWGKIQDSKQICRGIRWVSTASHGGIIVSPKTNRLIPEYMRISSGNYEQDNDLCIPILCFQFQFESFYKDKWKDVRNSAIQTFKNWHPESYEKFFNVILSEGESLMKDKEIFMEKNKNNLIVTCAWGDWDEKTPEGMVRVSTRKISDSESGCLYNARYFLIPKEEYKPGKFGFIVDSNKYQEVFV